MNINQTQVDALNELLIQQKSLYRLQLINSPLKKANRINLVDFDGELVQAKLVGDLDHITQYIHEVIASEQSNW